VVEGFERSWRAWRRPPESDWPEWDTRPGISDQSIRAAAADRHAAAVSAAESIGWRAARALRAEDRQARYGIGLPPSSDRGPLPPSSIQFKASRARQQPVALLHAAGRRQRGTTVATGF